MQTSFKHVNFSRLKVKFHDFSVTLKKYVSSELFPDLTFLNDIISDRKIHNREIIKKQDIYAINKEIRISSYSIANLYSEMKLFSIATYSGRRRDLNSFKTVLNYA